MMFHLYIKQCSHCNLKYFGRTTKNPFTYSGSGTKWLKHISKHRAKPKTLTVWSFNSVDECSICAQEFSDNHNISASQLWANLRAENGRDGRIAGDIPWNKGKNGVQVAWNKGKKLPSPSKESNIKRANSLKKYWATRTHNRLGVPPWNKGTKGLYSSWNKGLPAELLTCPHCLKTGGGKGNMLRWHFANCKSVSA